MDKFVLHLSMNYVVFCVFTIAANDKNQHADNYCKPSEYICYLKIGLSISIFSCPLHVAFMAKKYGDVQVLVNKAFKTPNNQNKGDTPYQL